MTKRSGGGWLSVIRGERVGAAQGIALAGLRALSVLYGAALHVHLAAYRLGIARRTRLDATVVSIGNLTMGGSGKTTAALAVAEWMREQGRRVAILSRGYRGKGENEALIVSQGEGPLAAPDVSGDEPYLLAQKLPGVSVLVGKDRRVTGRLAVDALGADSIILDDGFQYQRLHRDVDIVLVDALLPFGYDALVPRGLLREPLGHLGRADAVWITHCDSVPPKDVDALRDRIAALAPEARIWETIHAPIRVRRLGDSEEADPAELRGRRVCALSGLGNPAAFESTLTALGAEIAGVARFPDHHRYGVEELHETAALQAAEAEWIVTTEKDAVRLPKCELAKPLWVLEIALAGWRKDASLAEEMTCLLRAKSRS